MVNNQYLVIIDFNVIQYGHLTIIKYIINDRNTREMEKHFDYQKICQINYIMMLLKYDNI